VGLGTNRVAIINYSVERTIPTKYLYHTIYYSTNILLNLNIRPKVSIDVLDRVSANPRALALV